MNFFNQRMDNQGRYTNKNHEAGKGMWTNMQKTAVIGIKILKIEVFFSIQSKTVTTST